MANEKTTCPMQSTTERTAKQRATTRDNPFADLDLGSKACCAACLADLNGTERNPCEPCDDAVLVREPMQLG